MLPQTPPFPTWIGKTSHRGAAARSPLSIVSGGLLGNDEDNPSAGSLQSPSSQLLWNHSHGPAARPPEPRGRLRSHLLLTHHPWQGWHLPGTLPPPAWRAPLGILASESVVRRHPSACHPLVRSIRARLSFTQECFQPPAANR